jgi:syntaxin 1B/2/3
VRGFPALLFFLLCQESFISLPLHFFFQFLCLAMNDLLSTFSGRKTGEGYDDDLETGPSVQMTGMAAGDKDLSRFFAEIEKIKNQMDRIRELLVKLQEANEESKGVHKAQAMKALRDRMDADIAQVTKIARSIKAELEELDRGNAANRRVKGCEEGTPTDRTRTTITNNQRKKLKDLMGEFQALRERMMGEYKETIERRFFYHQNSLPFL